MPRTFFRKKMFRLFKIIDGDFRFNSILQIVKQARFEIVVNASEESEQFFEAMFFVESKINIRCKFQNWIPFGKNCGEQVQDARAPL